MGVGGQKIDGSRRPGRPFKMVMIVEVRRFHVLFLISMLSEDGPIKLSGEDERLILWNRVKMGLQLAMERTENAVRDLPEVYFNLALTVLGPLLIANDGALTKAMLERCWKMTEPDGPMFAGKDEEYYRQMCGLAKHNFPFYSSLNQVVDVLNADVNDKIEKFSFSLVD